MNIILVSNKMAKAKTLSSWQTAAAIAGLLLVPMLITALFILPKLGVGQAANQVVLPADLKSTADSTQLHLDAYAKQIGELQARIMRLDAQNKRLVKLAGVKETKATAKLNGIKLKPAGKIANLGGPLVRVRPMTEADLQLAISELAEAIGSRDEYMGDVEADVLKHSVLKDMLPNSRPVKARFRSSSYGWRSDPFNGSRAFHEGLDFTARMGAPIRAAADGIVTSSKYVSAYGNLVKINHGAGLETRYAHASKLLVKAGERVVKGQVIAKVGSTGRSTGPHLHYEIRLNGHSLDPRKYLNKKPG